MDVLSCNTSSHFPCWQWTLESDIWCANWESTLAQVTWYNQWVADICLQSFSNLPYTLEKWYGTLQQQWMSYPATHHPIFYAEGGSQFWHFFCAIWESTLAEIAQCYPYVTDRCFQKLLSSTWYIKWMIWNSLVAMAAFPCNASPYFWCWDSTPNLTFCVQFESQPWQKLHNVNHKWLTDSFRSSSHLHYISMEGYETLHKQWMFFPAAHHSIFPAERVSQI